MFETKTLLLVLTFFLSGSQSATPIEYNSTTAPTPTFCCASRVASCSACTSYFTAPACNSTAGCTIVCGGMPCTTANPPAASPCTSGVSFGTVRATGVVSVPSYLLHLDTSTAGRRLLQDRHTIGVLRSLPFGIGTIAALATPGYDNVGGDLSPELIDANNRISALSDTVADLANKTALETTLRVQADQLLSASITSLTDQMNVFVDHTRAALQANTNSIVMLTARVSIAEASAIYLSELQNNIDLARAPIESPVVQKFLKLASLGEFLPSLKLNFSSDTTTFLAHSMFMYSGYDYDPVFPVTCGQVTEVNVTRHPTALSFLSPVGDNYIYEVSYRPLSKIMGPVDADLITPAGTPCYNITNTNRSAADFMACRVSTYLYCVEKGGGHFSWRCSGSYNLNSTFGVSTSYNPRPTRVPQCCAGVCANNCTPSSMFSLTCNDALDLVGPRPTGLWIPAHFGNDVFVREYTTADGILYSGSLHSSPYLNYTPPTPMYHHYTDFFDPIYIAKKLFTPRSFVVPPFFASLLYSGNSQDNTVFGDFGEMTSVPVGYLSGVTTPVIIDPQYFSSSFDIISWYQGSPPLAGWSPNTGCVLEGATMCCQDFVVSDLLHSISLQLGYNASALPTQFATRNLFDTVQFLVEALDNINNLTLITVPPDIRARLDANFNTSLQLIAQLKVLEGAARNISHESKAANDRIASLESAPSPSFGIVALVLCIVGGILLICICLSVSRSRMWTKV